MRPLSLRTRLMLLLIAFAVLACGITGSYAYLKARSLLAEAAERELLTATQVLARRLALNIDEIGRDARMMASYPAMRLILAGSDAARVADAEKRMEDVFAAVLAEQRTYFQVRLIGAADYGLERVRVDRDESGLAVVRGDSLQEKGHYPYVRDTLALPRGAIYLSEIDINQEIGAHAGLGKPSLRVGAPVIDAAGETIGAIVINADLNQLFALLRQDLPDYYQLYLTNQRGDYLIHPDAEQTFGFVRGLSLRLQQWLPAAQQLVDGQRRQLVQVATPASGKDSPLLSAFVRVPLSLLNAEREAIVGLAVPQALLLDETYSLGFYLWVFVLLFSGVAVVVAVLLSRTLTQPLSQMAAAAEHFGRNREIQPLPVERSDELGTLARNLATMQHQLVNELGAIEASRRQLDYLANHDPLTGLANRRMFFELLELALARSRRSQLPLSLLFIDLDRFKTINDCFGHDAGDEVLVRVASLLKGAVREVDVVARLSGDEFVILLESLGSEEGIQRIVDEILLQLGAPFLLRSGHSLTLGASIGFSLYPRDADDAEALLQHADQAMYVAKRQHDAQAS